MRVEILGLSEVQVLNLCHQLQSHGLRYEEDHEALYGQGWVSTGVRLTSEKAIGLVLQQEVQVCLKGTEISVVD